MKLTLTQADGPFAVTVAVPGTISWPVQAVQAQVTANTATTTISPSARVSVVVTVTRATTIEIGSGYAGQALRLEVRQDSSGGHAVALGTSIVTGADVPSFSASVAANTRDLLQLIAADTSHWMLVAINHGFGV